MIYHNKNIDVQLTLNKFIMILLLDASEIFLNGAIRGREIRVFARGTFVQPRCEVSTRL